MVSRRRILSRSRDELHSLDYHLMSNGGAGGEGEGEDDDVWASKDRLYRVRITLFFFVLREIYLIIY